MNDFGQLTFDRKPLHAYITGAKTASVVNRYVALDTARCEAVLRHNRLMWVQFGNWLVSFTALTIKSLRELQTVSPRDEACAYLEFLTAGTLVRCLRQVEFETGSDFVGIDLCCKSICRLLAYERPVHIHQIARDWRMADVIRYDELVEESERNPEMFMLKFASETRQELAQMDRPAPSPVAPPLVTAPIVQVRIEQEVKRLNNDGGIASRTRSRCQPCK